MRVMMLQGHDRPVSVVKFTEPGDMFFTGSAGAKVNLWESYSGERLGSYSINSSVKTLDLSYDHKHLLTGSLNGNVQLFEVDSGRNLGLTTFAAKKIKYLEVAQGGEQVLLLAEDYRRNNFLWVYRFKDLIGLLQGESNQPSLQVELNVIATRVSWRMLNKGFTISTADGQLMNLDESGKQLLRVAVHKGQINSFTFAPDFSIMMTAAADGSKVLDPDTFQVLRTIKQSVPMNSVSISPLFCHPTRPLFQCVMGGGISAQQAALSQRGGYEVHICNVMYEEEVGRLSGHFGPINSLQYMPDGRGFVSGGEEGITRVWTFQEDYFKQLYNDA